MVLRIASSSASSAEQHLREAAKRHRASMATEPSLAREIDGDAAELTEVADALGALVDRGKHVATVYGDAGDVTDGNAACLAASAEMLTTLVDLATAHCRGHDLPWHTAQSAILAGFGAPAPGDGFVSRHPERDESRTHAAGTTWQIARVGFCGSRRVMVRDGPARSRPPTRRRTRSRPRRSASTSAHALHGCCPSARRTSTGSAASRLASGASPTC